MRGGGGRRGARRNTRIHVRVVDAAAKATRSAFF
jgi:hypothetical protein